MNIVPPITMPTTTVQAVSHPVLRSREERQQALLLHRRIRASVEEGGQDKALLHFGDRKLWVESRVPLLSGDQLNLQVIETHPQLKLRILDSGLLERLGRSLHLLGHRLDVSSLTATLLKSQSATPPQAEQIAIRQALSELLGALQRNGDQPPASQQLQNLSALLGLGLERQLLSGLPQQAVASLKNAVLELNGQLHQTRSALAEHLAPLFKALEGLAQTTNAGNVSPVASGEPVRHFVESLLALVRLHGAPDKAAAPALVQQLGGALARHLQPFAEHARDNLARLQQVLAHLPAWLAQPAGDAAAMAHLDPLQRDLLNVMLRLLRGGAERLSQPEGQNLLKRLAGGLEKELFAGPNRALDKNSEALSHLELWQMCRARLGEIGVDFVPLPFDFLEHGYLLGRRRGNPETSDEAASDYTLTLFLELEGLGPLQIDCLYQEQGLYLKFACRDAPTAHFLSGGREELLAALGEELLHSASFAAAAEAPSQALIRKLIPAETSLINARV